MDEGVNPTSLIAFERMDVVYVDLPFIRFFFIISWAMFTLYVAVPYLHFRRNHLIVTGYCAVNHLQSVVKISLRVLLYDEIMYTIEMILRK